MVRVQRILTLKNYVIKSTYIYMYSVTLLYQYIKVECRWPSQELSLNTAACTQPVSSEYCYSICSFLTPKAPNTTIAEFTNTEDPDETALRAVLSGSIVFALLSLIFQHNAVYIESFSKFCRRNFVICIFGALPVKALLCGGTCYF